MKRSWRVVAVLAWLLRPALASADADHLSQVWAREDDYWRFVKAGDVESYEKLWHERFVGWPCGQEHPLRKASIGNWVKQVRDKGIKVDLDLTREGAEDFGDTVVVHYRFTKADTYPDGHVEGQGRISKITHTWMRAGDTWLIVGGMCGGVDHESGGDIVGAWFVKAPGAPFPYHVFVFNADGTMQQANPDAGDGGTSDSDGMGAWAREGDRVVGRFVEVTADRSTRAFVSRGEISFDLVVDGDTFKGSATGRFYGADEKPTHAPASTTLEGRRIRPR